MDVLKVLTRSTNLGKRKAGRDPHRRELPSSGAPNHPQALAESPSAATKEISRGVKRKRRGAAISQDASGIPDFFGSGRADSGAQDAENESNEEVDVVPILDKVQAPQGEALDLDERKQVLRKHKLKVHVVTAGSVKRSKDAKSKKRKKEVDKKVTATFDAIYPQPVQSFKGLRQTRLSKRLLKNLEDQGYMVPTEVQMAALSLFLSSENGLPTTSQEKAHHVDTMTVAPTGSGKTLAFLIPVMNDLLAERAAEKTERRVRAIVLAPTHELADQIVNEARKLAEGTGLRAAAMQKNMQLFQDSGEGGTEALIKADIVVSTPLLLANSLEAKEGEEHHTLPSISHLVLDEADVLLDPMFREQTMKIWDQCVSEPLRVSLWSATMGASIESFATEYIFGRLQKAERSVRKDHKLVRIIAGLKDSAIPNVRHHLTYAATEQGKLLAMRQLLHPSTNTTSDPTVRPPFLVFAQTIPRAVALHSELLYDIPAEAGGGSRIAVLHSDLSLSARSDIMAKFRKGEIWVLITTDLLSRGVDFRGVNGVVNYDIPTSGAGYVHRAGRTGRAGREGGVCVTLYTKEDIPYVKNVANVIAAAEKLKGKTLGEDGTAMPQWLLDALPDLSKEVKKELKRKGVAARRSEKGGKVEGKGKMRISTKSGYERKIENSRKAAKTKPKKVDDEADEMSVDGNDSDGFGGFDD